MDQSTALRRRCAKANAAISPISCLALLSRVLRRAQAAKLQQSSPAGAELINATVSCFVQAPACQRPRSAAVATRYRPGFWGTVCEVGRRKGIKGGGSPLEQRPSALARERLSHPHGASWDGVGARCWFPRMRPLRNGYSWLCKRSSHTRRAKRRTMTSRPRSTVSF